MNASTRQQTQLDKKNEWDAGFETVHDGTFHCSASGNSIASECVKGETMKLNPSAAIAQLGERQTEDLKVPGSIPGLGIP